MSVPNFGHWYPRARTALGAFDYDQRGILDRTHYRFFTRKSLSRMLTNAGFEIRRHSEVGLPLDLVAGEGDGTVMRFVRALDRICVTLRPTLFAYQFVLHLERRRTPELVTSSGAPTTPADSDGPLSAA